MSICMCEIYQTCPACKDTERDMSKHVADAVGGVEDHWEAYERLCSVLGMTEDMLGFHSAEAMSKAADEIEKLRRERTDLLSYLKGISRQTAEMVKSHGE